ncbi:MAG: C40 family peptidase [Limnohabitans sp.]
MNAETRLDAMAHAQKEQPRECCGLVVVVRGRERYWPCQNIGHGTDHFVIDPDDYAEADDAGEIIAVVHSHPGLPVTPSQADRVGCNQSGVPWYICNPLTGDWGYLEPDDYVAPLVGREWCHGLLDCYSLVRDWYAQEMGLNLRNYSRSDEWWHRGENLYIQNFQAEGFRVLAEDEPLRRGDALLMQLGSPVPNHAAVYLGDDMVLHHLQRRLSSRDVYGGYYRKCTTHRLRYAQSDSAG